MTPRAITVLAMVLGGASSLSANELYFPTKEWTTVGPAEVGWDTEHLETALDYAMSQKSSAVVVLHRGRILAERHQALESTSLRYRSMTRGHNQVGHIIEDVASVQKSVVSFLVGVAREKGLVKLDDSVSKHLGPGWSEATRQQESAITLRHLISMTSGLNARLKYADPPGSKWQYNTSAYSRSLTVISKAAKLSENELTEEWLTEPTGMSDSKWVPRRGTTESLAANPYGFATTAHDLARFGLLMLAQGQWEDQTLLSDRKYLVDSVSPSQTHNPSYGFLWWLNGQPTVLRGSRSVPGPLIQTAPSDLYAGFGALGRKCYVVPSLDVVVIRLGDAPEGPFDVEFWKRLSQAVP